MKNLKYLFASLLLLSSHAFAVGRIQNEDVKSLSDLTGAGGAMSQLINDSKMYVTGGSLNEQLSTAITNGDFPLYLRTNGSRALTANWAAGSFSATFNSVDVGSAANTISGLATIVNSGTLTLPTATDTLVARTTTDTLTNKTLTSPAITGATVSGSSTLTDASKIVNASDATKDLAFSLSGMTTGKTLTLSSSQSTNQTLTLPNITGSDTLATLGLPQTFSGATTFSASLSVGGTLSSNLFSGTTYSSSQISEVQNASEANTAWYSADGTKNQRFKLFTNAASSTYGIQTAYSSADFNFVIQSNTANIFTLTPAGNATVAGALTVNGTGNAITASASSSSNVIVRSTNTSTGTAAYAGLAATNSAGHDLDYLYTSTAFSGAAMTNGVTGESGNIYTSGAFPLSIGTHASSAINIDTSQNVTLVENLTVNGSASNFGSTSSASGYILSIQSNTTGGSGYAGLQIKAGTTLSSEFPFVVSNAANNLNYFTITGNGAVTAQGVIADGIGSGAAAVFQAGSPGNALDAGSAFRFQDSNTHTNWEVSANLRGSSGAYNITPSTAGGGTTFSTPVWSMDSSGNTTQSGNLTVNGTGASSLAGETKVEFATGTSGSFPGLLLQTTSASTSNTTHQVSPSLFLEGGIWGGGANTVRGFQIQTMGVSGQDFGYLLNINSGDNSNILQLGPGGALNITGNFTEDGSQIAIAPTTTTNNAYVTYINGGGAYYLGADGSTGSSWGHGNYAMVLRRPGSTTFAIDHTSGNDVSFDSSGNASFPGNVGIGTTASTQALFVQGTASNYTGKFTASSGTGTSFGVQINAGTNGSDAALIVRNQGQSSTFLNITGAGVLSSLHSTLDDSTGNIFIPNMSNNGTGIETGEVCWTTSTGKLVYNTSGTCFASSERYKHSIKSLDNIGLSQVMALRPVTYYRNLEEGSILKNDVNFTHEKVGFIAEEVQKVNPDFVPLDNEGKPQTVVYQEMVPLLTKAIQEQQAEIATLKSEIADLKAQSAE